jgi:hypothetical protein
MSKPKVFISYSHVDEKRWKNRLQKHLKVYYIERDPGLARLFAEEKEEEEDD